VDLTVTVTLINVLTGKQAMVNAHDMSMDAGAGIVQWFCPGGTNTSSVNDTETALRSHIASSYTQHEGQIPTDRGNFTKVASGTAETCEGACNADKDCLGYTRVGPNTGGTCWLYETVASLINSSGDSWWQKPGTNPIPAAPPPPPPPPPPPGTAALACVPWTAIPAWGTLNCDSSPATVGANCLLTVVVTIKGNSSAVLSSNELPFQPPKQMRIPSQAAVTAKVGAFNPTTGRVPIALQATDTALYVTLTTLAAGRFSDNAFLLLPATNILGPSLEADNNANETGHDEATSSLTTTDDDESSVEFIPWGEFGETQAQLLASSLRVQHLAENL
jgi:hypothetical protein